VGLTSILPAGKGEEFHKALNPKHFAQAYFPEGGVYKQT
jgi:hypothetical protein